MRIKGIKKLNAHMNKFLSPFGLKCTFGSDFAYWTESELIQYTIFLHQDSDVYFSDFIKKEFDFSVTDIFLVSLLHEVGHYYTIDDFEEDELLEDEYAKAGLTRNPLITEKERNFRYFNLPVEYAATEWAIDFLRDNPSIYHQWGIMLEHFRHFYKKNNISLD